MAELTDGPTTSTLSLGELALERWARGWLADSGPRQRYRWPLLAPAEASISLLGSWRI